MPRARCHWALLVQTREALQSVLPSTYALVLTHRGEFFAGGLAPDAIRLFSGYDKLTSHFYDDQRPETWEGVVTAIQAAHPAVAPALLSPPARAWMLGYLTHVMTDVAYWRHVITHLPPFPGSHRVHHGAWLLADQVPVPPDERQLDAATVRFDAAPPWVDDASVRRMLARVTERILVPDGMWPVELAYYRMRSEIDDRPDEEVLRECQPEWEANVAEVREVLPHHVWPVFYADAVTQSVEAIATYLTASTATSRPA